MDMPVIGIVVNEKIVETHLSYAVMEKYVIAVVKFAQAAPVLIPPLGQVDLVDSYLDFLDGILLTGGKSDIHPSHYNQEVKNPDSFFDKRRDETSLNLIRRALAKKMPIFGICRGLQEINVALGGSLHQSVHRNPSFLDHREVQGGGHEVSYAFRHRVDAKPDGKLAKIVHQSHWQVNSLHDQGIDKLANGLQIEAYAEDGLIEAVSLKSDEQFLLATQWHLEWSTELDNCSTEILRAFGVACTEYKKSKHKSGI